MSAPTERYNREWAREEYQHCRVCKTWTDTGCCECSEADAAETDKPTAAETEEDEPTTQADKETECPF
jgi:hypothetical protein